MFTAGDLLMVQVLRRLNGSGILEEYPHLAAYVARGEAQPAFKRAFIAQRHFVFLVSEAEFDAIFQRIKQRGLAYWADPFHKQSGTINHWDDGRGVYFDDPNGHLIEIITRPYGSGGLDAKHPNPLLK